MLSLENFKIHFLNTKSLTVDNWDVIKDSNNQYVLEIYQKDFIFSQKIVIPLSDVFTVMKIQVANHYNLPISPPVDFENDLCSPDLFREFLIYKTVIDPLTYSAQEAFIMINAGYWMTNIENNTVIWRNKDGVGQWQTAGKYPYNIRNSDKMHTLSNIKQISNAWKNIKFLNRY